MACGIVPAISEAPLPPSRTTAPRRPASGTRRDDVGPGAHAEDPARLADAVAIAIAQVGPGGLRVDVGGDRPRRSRELLAQPAELQDLVAQCGGSLELQVARGFLHLRL